MKNTLYFQWHITHLCNLRCRHCYHEVFTASDELSDIQLRDVATGVLDDLAKEGKKACITLTGGEPFLRSDIYDFLSFLNAHDAVTELELIANGLLVNESVLDLCAAYGKLKTIKVSLESLDQQKNDTIRGNGAYEKILRAASLIRATQRYSLVLMFTLMRGNVRELPGVIDFCRAQGIDAVIVERFFPLGNGVLLQNELLDKEAWHDVVRTWQNEFEIEDNGDTFLPYHGFKIDLCGDTPELLGALCTVGDGGVCIMPNADVYPCRRFARSIGNLQERSLIDILRESTVLQQVRDRNALKGKCHLCAIENCFGCRAMALALTGDYLAEDVQCWK